MSETSQSGLPAETVAPAVKASIPFQVNDEYILLPIDELHDPNAPMRETMDEVLLAELADSIVDTGLQNPIRVFKAAEGYEVISGHRRLLACRLAGVSPVPCIVDRNDGISTIAKMVAENTAREDVNPIEEARLYRRALVEMCHGDVDELADLVKRRRAHVEDRLRLLEGDPRVAEAIEQRKLSLAVARELNKVEDTDRRLVFLDAAIRGGATARTVMEWRTQSALLPPSPPAPDCDVSADGQAHRIPPAPGFECFFCGDSNDVHLMELFYMHRQCKRFVLRKLGIDPDQLNQGEK